MLSHVFSKANSVCNLGGHLLRTFASPPVRTVLHNLQAFSSANNVTSLNRLLRASRASTFRDVRLTSNVMASRAEQKKLKRTLLREILADEFDQQTTEIAWQAAAVDRLCSDHESDSEKSIPEVFDSQCVITVPDFAQGASPRPVSPLSDSTEQSASLPTTTKQNTEATDDGCSVSHLCGSSDDKHSSDESAEDNTSEYSCDGYMYVDDGDDFNFDTTAHSGAVSLSEAGSGAQSDIAGDLINWCFEHNIKHTALDGLLAILRNHGHSTLPKLSVTLLATPHQPSSDVVTLGSGQYWYHGLLTCFKAYFKPPMSINGEVVIDFFVDGVSPYDKPSKAVHLWPIAGRIICEGLKTKPFIIALWCGSSHEPENVDDFLNPFVNECLELKDGFVLNGVQYKLKIRNAIADGPARSMMKKTNPHQSVVSCERCVVRCSRVQNTMVFPICKCDLRTDESFVNKSDPDYHRGTSPLEKNIKMISQVPLEPLHLVDLGVAKRVLKMLIKTKGSRVYLRPTTIAKIDKMIDVLSHFSPSEFGQWKPKGLRFYNTYKGKELKRFLKYDGLLTMWLIEQELPTEHKGVFKCFLHFSLGIRILSDRELCLPFSDDANYLLNEFVKQSVKKVFGPHFVVYNVHHLTHLADECKLHGPLEGFDAYIYESHLGQLGKLLNAPGRPLPQIIARLLEREKHGYSGPPSPPKAQLSKPHRGPTDQLVGTSYGTYESGEYAIRVSTDNDQCCLMKNNDVVIVENIVQTKDGIFLVGRSFIVKEPFFVSPIDSTHLNIYKVRSLGPISHWPLNNVKRKCFLMPLDLDEEVLEERFVNGCLIVPFTH